MIKLGRFDANGKFSGCQTLYFAYCNMLLFDTHGKFSGWQTNDSSCLYSILFDTHGKCSGYQTVQRDYELVNSLTPMVNVVAIKHGMSQKLNYFSLTPMVNVVAIKLLVINPNFICV